LQRPPRDRDAAARRSGPVSPEDRAALWFLLFLHAALVGALVLAGITLANLWPGIQIAPWQKVAFEVGIGITIVVFVIRAFRLWQRIRSR
jgi:hypothetical protein